MRSPKISSPAETKNLISIETGPLNIRQDFAIQFSQSDKSYYVLVPHKRVREPSYMDSYLLVGKEVLDCHIVIIHCLEDDNYFVLHVSPVSLQKARGRFSHILPDSGVVEAKPAYHQLNPRGYNKSGLGIQRGSELEVIIVVNDIWWSEEKAKEEIIPTLQENILGTIIKYNIIVTQALTRARSSNCDYDVIFNAEKKQLDVKSSDRVYSEHYSHPFDDNRRDGLHAGVTSRSAVEIKSSAIEAKILSSSVSCTLSPVIIEGKEEKREDNPLYYKLHINVIKEAYNGSIAHPNYDANLSSELLEFCHLLINHPSSLTVGGNLTCRQLSQLISILEKPFPLSNEKGELDFELVLASFLKIKLFPPIDIIKDPIDTFINISIGLKDCHIMRSSIRFFTGWYDFLEAKSLLLARGLDSAENLSAMIALRNNDALPIIKKNFLYFFEDILKSCSSSLNRQKVFNFICGYLEFADKMHVQRVFINKKEITLNEKDWITLIDYINDNQIPAEALRNILVGTVLQKARDRQGSLELKAASTAVTSCGRVHRFFPIRLYQELREQFILTMHL